MSIGFLITNWPHEMSDALAFLTSQSQSCRLLSQPNCLAQLERLKDRRRSVSPKIFKFVLKCCFADWKRRELISNGQSALLAKAILADCGKASPKIPRLLRIIRQTQKCLEEKRETDDLQTQLDLMADRQMKLMGTTLVDLSHNNAENWLNDINWALIPPLWRPEAMNKVKSPFSRSSILPPWDII